MKIKKYGIVLVVLLLAVMVSGCTSDQTIPTKNFSKSGMSFMYPDTWNVTSQESANATLILIKNEEILSSNGAKGCVVLILKVSNASKSNMTQTRDEFATQALSGKNFTNTTIKIASSNASDMSYIGKDTQKNESYARLIDFTKNDTLYILMFATVGGSDMDAAKQYFDVIVKSFKVT
ncbi:MAG: PsbP-related protein [Euryarchaeota archaeon]|uniref:PsbP-related protein n=1 Tax=Methanobacterium sp. MZD130B TaxID=3394378 RepID=UPI0009C4D80D|nr:PsbP-related protein [Euryarchaeota archaeon]OPZ94353.1 MAG: hypothetical protein BWY74_00640 [Firmicutes bacterium ADurb.Bin419]HHT18627.1 hypothetical protein [Methanobacterium sp.]